jgi:hypothetical protein
MSPSVDKCFKKVYVGPPLLIRISNRLEKFQNLFLELFILDSHLLNRVPTPNGASSPPVDNCLELDK